MTDSDSFTEKRGTSVHGDVIAHLEKNGIAVNPSSFRIWYDYFAKTNDELVNKIDSLSNKGTIFTDRMVDELYKGFYRRNLSGESSTQVLEEIKAAEKVSLKAGQLLVGAIKEIISSVNSTTEYGNSLRGYVDKVNKASGIDEIETVLKSLLSDTAEVTNKNESIEKKLTHSSTRLKKLSSELEDAKKKAYRDNLTKLYNRRHFDEKLAECLELVSDEFICSLIIFDIDLFKKFNDTYGHLVGDNLLSNFGMELIRATPKESIPCRYGGEEFVIIFPKSNGLRALRLAEEIRLKVEEMEFMVKGKSVPVTVSAGVSQFKEGDEPADIIGRADKALYLAKYSGRNQVKVESGES